MTSTLSGGVGSGGKAKIRCYQMQGVVGGWGSECSGRPIFIFFIKENWICALTRLHAESIINILLTKNLPIDSGVRQ